MSKIFLAPMEGLADALLRDLITRAGGYDGAVCEFIRVSGSTLPVRTFRRVCPELDAGSRTSCGTPVVVQLLGSCPERLGETAARLARLSPCGIDLNFGCPAPTVNKHQGGAVLLKEPERVFHIVKTLRAALPEHIPLTGKMRLGFEDKSLALENACAIAEGGACALTVHARTKVEGYEPPAHWVWVRKIREAVAIPVTANGDVFTLDDYLGIKRESGCDSVMLGRGAVMRPDLARQIKQYERGEAVDAADFAEVMGWIRLFFDLCLEKEAQNKYPVARLKQWLGMLKKVYPEAHTLFEAVRTIKEADEVKRALDESRFNSA